MYYFCCQASSFLEEKEKLKTQLSTTSAHVKDDKEQENVSVLKKQIGSLQLECTRAKENSKNIEDKHIQTTVWDCPYLLTLFFVQEELLRVEKELERTKEELEQKVSETAQFRTMKTMLKSKSDQIKELRTKLQQ